MTEELSERHGGREASNRRAALFSLLLFVATLALNLIVVMLLRRHINVGLLDDDEHDYWRLANNFHSFGFSGIDARRNWPFPVFLDGLRNLFGNDYLRIQLSLSAFLALMPVIVYWLVLRQLANHRAAQTAGVISALWPPFVSYATTLYGDSFALLTFLVFLASMPNASESDSLKGWRLLRWCVSGALMGLSVQAKPLYLVYIPFGLLVAFLFPRRIDRRLLASSLLAAGCALAILPWSSYLSHREGHFLIVSTNDGETLAGGLNPALLRMGERSPLSSFTTAGGRTVWVGPGKWLSPESTGYLSEQEAKLPYVQMRDLLLRRSRAWILSHPLEVAYLSARKILYMWGIYPFWNGISQTILGNIPLLLLIAAAAYSTWMQRGALARLVMFWSLPIFCSLVALLSWGSWRFRMAGDVGLIVLASTMPIGALAPVFRAFLPGRVVTDQSSRSVRNEQVEQSRAP